MEVKPKILLAGADSGLIRHFIQIIANVEASNHKCPIIVVETEEKAREKSMLYQPWPYQIEIISRELKSFGKYMTMSAELDNAFAQSVFVNELALKKEKKNRKNNDRVQFKNKSFKFYNRKRSR